MGGINKIWTDLNDLTVDVQVLSYWENRKSRILDNLNTADSDFETVTNVIHRIAKSLNNREKYSSVYYFVSSSHKCNTIKTLLN